MIPVPSNVRVWLTETLEVIPRQWKVIQTVRERFACRSCEKISQVPAPFHPIARGRAGASLLAMVLYGKFGNHLPLNRQSNDFAREGIDLDTSTLADWVGACTACLSPLTEMIRRHVFGAARTLDILPDNGIAQRLAVHPGQTGRLTVERIGYRISTCRSSPIPTMPRPRPELRRGQFFGYLEPRMHSSSQIW